MSYSFSAKSATKADAILAVGKELDKVVAAQPAHAADAIQARDVATAFIKILPDDDTQDVSVSVSGSLGWTGTASDSHVITSAQVNVYASLVKRA